MVSSVVFDFSDPILIPAIFVIRRIHNQHEMTSLTQLILIQIVILLLAGQKANASKLTSLQVTSWIDAKFCYFDWMQKVKVRKGWISLWPRISL